MTRLPDWHSRYVAFINEIRLTPFEWGNDCTVRFVGRLYEVLTGEPNPAIDFDGKYDSMLSAVRAMRDAGFDNLKEAVSHYLGEPVHPSMAYTGDVACIPDASPFGYALGIVNGDRIFCRRDDGIGTIDLLQAESVFKI